MSKSKGEVIDAMVKELGRYKPTKEQMRTVLEFAINNHCVVNPMGWNSALEDFNEFKHCVCDPARPTCPCSQAPQEIAEKGHCKCHLFWKGYETYIKSRNLAGCSKGGDHEWGTDGAHQNVFCKKCFVSKVEE